MVRPIDPKIICQSISLIFLLVFLFCFVLLVQLCTQCEKLLFSSRRLTSSLSGSLCVMFRQSLFPLPRVP